MYRLGFAVLSSSRRVVDLDRHFLSCLVLFDFSYDLWTTSYIYLSILFLFTICLLPLYYSLYPVLYLCPSLPRRCHSSGSANALLRAATVAVNKHSCPTCIYLVYFYLPFIGFNIFNTHSH